MKSEPRPKLQGAEICLLRPPAHPSRAGTFSSAQEAPPGTFPPPWSEPLPGEGAGASQQEEVTGAGVATGHTEKRSFHWSVRARRGAVPSRPCGLSRCEAQVHGRVWLGDLCPRPGLLLCSYPFSILNDSEQGSHTFPFHWVPQIA